MSREKRQQMAYSLVLDIRWRRLPLFFHVFVNIDLKIVNSENTVLITAGISI